MKPQWEKKYPEANNNSKEHKLELIKKVTGANGDNISIKRIEIIEKEKKKIKINNDINTNNKQQSKELQLLKSNYKQLEKENCKMQEEVKNLKVTNFELKNQLSLIEEYEENINKLNEQILLYDKKYQDIQYKFCQIESESINTSKGYQSQLKQLNHTNQQLREVNADLKEKIAEYNNQKNISQYMIFDTVFIHSILEENKMLKNHLNTTMSELDIYKEKFNKAMKLVNQLNQSSTISINEKSDNEIQYGILHKDEQTKWIFFVGTNNESYIVQDAKGLNSKIGHFVAVEVIDEQYVKVIKVYKSKEV